MKIRTMVLTAAALGLGPCGWIMPHVSAQPLYDIVHVNLPYTVTVGNKTLPPGEYRIEQQRSDTSNVLLIYNGDGMKFETSTMTIKVLDTKTPEETSVILHHVGDDYYFDKIWVQGKDYGYQIPLPSSVKGREKEMSSVTVPASVSSGSSTSQSTTMTADNTNTTNTTASTTTATTNTDTTPVPPPTPVQTSDLNTQSTPVAPPVTEPQVTVDTTPAQPAVMADSGSANREKRSDTDTDTPSMPSTSAGWLAMLLTGGSLSGAGMMLRRKR